MGDVQEFLKKITGQSDDDWDRNVRLTRLATYNAERGRGIVHTDEWVAFMAEEQAEWNRSEFRAASNQERQPE